MSSVLGAPVFAVEPKAQAVRDIPFRSGFSIAQDVLTTEKIWILDPQEQNPHRRRWVLDRNVQCTGLQAIPRGTQFGLSACQLSATSKLYLRPEGPWYRPYSEFSCKRLPQNDRFATLEGTTHAGKTASDAWEATLESGRIRLGFLLKKIVGETPAVAAQKGQKVFNQWLKERDSEWRGRALQRAQVEEWKYYLKKAKTEGFCKKEQKDQTPPWEKMMEPVQGPVTEKFLTRAPARRWDGLFSVRVSMDVGGFVLNGQFLVDATAPTSIVSPVWMESQGVNPALFQIPNLPAERVKWVGGEGLARRLKVFAAGISGLTLPLQEFLVTDTELYVSPEYPSSCCDGVLGQDFIQLYALQFRTGIPAEVIVWPREGFRWGEDVSWNELHVTEKGELASSLLKSPLQPGLGVLGRGMITFDLPHGRLWHSKETLATPERVNRTGLELVYRFGKGEQKDERELRVKMIRKSGASAPLLQAGLKTGMQILEIDSRPAEDVDQWEVQQRLSGVYGDTVTLKWKTSDGFRIAPLKVR